MAQVTDTDGDSSDDVLTDRARQPAAGDRSLKWGSYLLALSGVGLVANALAMLYRAIFDPAFEAGVHTLGGATRADLVETNPAVVHYIDHLHVNVAGLLAAAGIAVVALAWFGVRRGQRWALGTAVTIPVVFLAHSIPVHQTAGFSFDALTHLGPGLVWLPAVLAGAILAARGLRSVDGRAGRGDER